MTILQTRYTVQAWKNTNGTELFSLHPYYVWLRVYKVYESR